MARLCLRGIDDVAWARLADLPELWAGLPALPERDELAVEHHTSFHLGVFPYAGVFLSSSAEAGAWSDRVAAYYARAGFAPRLDDVSADHLGVMLAFLAFVTGAQADACEDGREDIVARLDATVAEFLETCVLSWLPGLAVAVDGLGSRFWANLVIMALGTSAHHRADLRHPHRPVRLPEAGSPLADPSTGLRGIAEFLLTPALAGVFLTRADIADLGRRHEVPRGFGSRAQMLTNLLRSAVDLGQLPAVLDGLDALLRTRLDALSTLAVALSLHGHIDPWRRRMHATRGIVLELATHARKGDPTWRSEPSTTMPPAP